MLERVKSNCVLCAEFTKLFSNMRVLYTICSTRISLFHKDILGGNIKLLLFLLLLFCFLLGGLPQQLSWSRVCLQYRRPWFNSCVGKICWRRDRLPTPVFLVFPGSSGGKESARNAGRFPGEGNGYLLQYSGLDNPMDYTDHSQTRLRDFHFQFYLRTFSPVKNLTI